MIVQYWTCSFSAEFSVLCHLLISKSVDISYTGSILSESGNLSRNAMQGEGGGWRTAREIKDIREDYYSCCADTRTLHPIFLAFCIL